MNRFAYSAVVVSLVGLLVSGGCAKKTQEVQVSGKVSIDGEPIGKGTISFVAADGATPTGGGVIKDGDYTATVPPGEKIVMVVGNKLIGQEPEFPDMPDSPMRDKYEMITPEAYNAKELSPLKASITGPQAGLDFELSKDVKTK
jgi:hypothetical protein